MKAILAELRGEFVALYRERLAQMLLFGSQARGDAAPDSDIDVLVILNGEVKPEEEIRRAGAITAKLSLKYDAVISCAFVSADRFAAGQSPFIRNVRREGVAV